MLSDDSDNEDVHQLTINEHYAKAFEYRKEREELAKLKEKYGSDAEDLEEEDSEDAESEDEDGEELTPAVDAAILRTLARIKRKDPSIYESGKDVFEEERQKTGESTLSKRAPKDKSKPLTIRQHVLQSALNPASRSPSPQPLTHVEEQKALKQETIAAFHGAVASEADDEDDDILIPREKTKDELEREEEEYKEFLEREVGEDLRNLVTVEENLTVVDEEEPESGKKKKRDKGAKREKGKASQKTKAEEDQEFLMSYILNRGWIDKTERRLPTYKEITGKDKGKAKAILDDDMSENETDDEKGDNNNEFIDDEDEFDDVADYFESTYNFRYEEPGATEIARHPRNIESLVRRQDSSRKDERERRKARKEEELRKKKEEVKRLKALKMKELRAKLERIGVEGGKNLEETTALESLDLEGDWDPDSHDRQMADIYGQDDGDLPFDDEKPHWDDDIDIGDIVPPEALEDYDDEGGDGESKKKKKKKKKKSKEDEWDDGGVDIDEMDADFEGLREEEWDGSEEMRKQVLEKYLDEVYDLEFNDVVAGLPTRFKYAKVQPHAFALTPEEILLATDAELNQYMGIKKYAPYRKEGSNWDKNRAARLGELKNQLKERREKMMGGRGLESYDDVVRGGGEGAEKPMKKRKGKKERMKAKLAAGGIDGVDADDAEGAEAEVKVEKERKGKEGKSTKRKTPENEETQESQEGPSKKKRRRHKKSGHSQVETTTV